jgi:transposase-like protein
MARSAIQFQKGLSLSEFQRLYGTEEQCEAALENARWPDGFRCPRCGGHEHGLVYGRRLKRYQCRSCGHQATLTAGTIMQAPHCQESCPLGLTRPPGGPTDDHATAL